jgi:hypothetical protein
MVMMLLLFVKDRSILDGIVRKIIRRGEVMKNIENLIAWDLFKSEISEDAIFMRFGTLKKGVEKKFPVKDEDVENIQCIPVPPSLLKSFCLNLENTGIQYQDKYGKDIGFAKADEK